MSKKSGMFNDDTIPTPEHLPEKKSSMFAEPEFDVENGLDMFEWEGRECVKTDKIIQDNLKKYVSQIDIDDLIDNWLTVFMNLKDPESNFTLGHWASFAGTEHSYVDVIGRNGEVLFQVPPLHPRNAYVPVNDLQKFEESEKLNDTISEAQAHAVTTGGQGAVVDLFDQLANRFHPDIIKKHKEEWEQFFKNLGVWDFDLEKARNGTLGIKQEPTRQLQTEVLQTKVSKPVEVIKKTVIEDNISPDDYTF